MGGRVGECGQKAFLIKNLRGFFYFRSDFKEKTLSFKHRKSCSWVSKRCVLESTLDESLPSLYRMTAKDRTVPTKAQISLTLMGKIVGFPSNPRRFRAENNYIIIFSSQ